MKGKSKKVGFLSDIHFPYEHTPSVNIALDFMAEWKPDVIVLGGDIYDFYPISRFNHSPARRHTIQDEIDSAKWFIETVDQLAKKVVFIKGNHEGRFSQTLAATPSLFDLRALEFRKVLDLPTKWEVIENQKGWMYGGVYWIHGDVKGVSERVMYPAATLLRYIRTTFVCGHYHRPGVAYQNDFEGLPDAGWVNGHLSDEAASEEYITKPNWQRGFITAEVNEEWQMPEVTQHIIYGDRMLSGGKVYQ